MKTMLLVSLLALLCAISKEEVETGVLNEAIHSVVYIEDLDGRGHGTGFYLEGKLLTCAHGCKANEVVRVIDYQGIVQTGKVVRHNPKTDLAEVGVELPKYGLKLARALKPLEVVLQIGNPAELRFAPTLGRFIGHDEKQNVFDITTYFGSSGSPLINMKGEVVGMTHAILDPRAGSHYTFGGTIEELSKFKQP